jgi:hypothetical protein
VRRLGLAALAALALPSGALAKEPVKVTVCGPAGCESSRDGGDMAALGRPGGPTVGPPASAGPGYKVHLTYREGHKTIEAFVVWQIPSLERLRLEDGTWYPMSDANLAALERLAKDHEPFPAAAVPLPRQTRKTPPNVPPTAAEDGGIAWWILAVGVALIGFAALFTRKLRKETHTWESSTARSRSSPGRPAA